MTDKLLPCPFCEGEAEFSVGKYGDGRDWHYVECGQCEAMGPKVSYADHGIRLKESLAEAWNARAALADAPQPAPEDAYSMFRRIYEESGGPSPELREAYAKYKAATAPHPAPMDRQALVEVIQSTLEEHRVGWFSVYVPYIADALLARGLRLPGGEMPLCSICANPCDTSENGGPEVQLHNDLWCCSSACYERHPEGGLKDERDAAMPETMAWAVVGKDGKIHPQSINNPHYGLKDHRGERMVRVAIRVVEGGDDAA